MNAPEKFDRYIDGMKYSIESATLIAHDSYWDGHNFERRGRNTFLYRTPRGRYFYVALSQWQGEQDTLQAVSPDEAVSMYEHDLSEHEVEYAEAFPHVMIEEA